MHIAFRSNTIYLTHSIMLKHINWYELYWYQKEHSGLSHVTIPYYNILSRCRIFVVGNTHPQTGLNTSASKMFEYGSLEFFFCSFENVLFLKKEENVFLEHPNPNQNIQN